jgi:WXXGXW repeat (2 copies)
MIRKLLYTSALGISLGIGPVAAQVVVRVAPPPAVVETRPAIPGKGYIWTPGYHRWNGTAYVWAPGRWVLPPRPHAAWVPGHWKHAHGGWVWIEGHWR